jgi:hypothetical protein
MLLGPFVGERRSGDVAAQLLEQARPWFDRVSVLPRDA